MASKPKRGPHTGQAVTLLCTRATGTDTQQSVTLGATFDKGGSSRLYVFEPALPDERVAKIYMDQYRTDTTLDPALKLVTLVARHDQLASTLPFVLWPDALVLDRANCSGANFREAVIGFTMARLPAGTVDLYTVLKGAKYRKQFQSGDTVRLAARLAGHLAQLHQAGFVFADLNPKNIHVNTDFSSLHFLDADGYQVPTRGKPLPARGVTMGYASPSAIGNFATQPTAIRSPADDNFVLAILIFQLLVDRAHPFDTGAQFAESPNATLNEGIVNRRYAFADPARFKPQADALALYARLVPPLKDALYRSFLGRQPLAAAEWARLLTVHAGAPLADHATPEPSPSILKGPPSAPSTPTTATRPRRPPSIPLPPVTAPAPMASPVMSPPRAFKRVGTIAAVAAPLSLGVWYLATPTAPSSAGSSAPHIQVASSVANTQAVAEPRLSPETERLLADMERMRRGTDAIIAKSTRGSQ